MSPEILAIATEFAELVRSYMLVIDSASARSPYAVLSSCARLLPTIYARALDLPDVDPEEDDFASEVSSPMSALLEVLGRYDVYREVFDPFYDEEVVVASLSDDLADIYLDFAGPLAAFDAGRVAVAVWNWKFSVKGHCGDHLVDALRAIHRLVNDHMDPAYDATARRSVRDGGA